MPIAVAESLDHEGRGVARAGGKTVFIEGALPGERVEYEVLRSRPNYEQACMLRVLKSSALRVTPPCPHYGVCGGCSMQHLDAAAQAAAKQRVLEDALWHVGRVRPGIVHAAIHGPAWAYRARARLTVRRVPSQGGVLLGFHQRRSSYVADMKVCPVLPAHVAAMLPALHKLVDGLSIADRLPQIELACGEEVTVLVFRILRPLVPADTQRLLAFAAQWKIRAWVQPDGPDSAYPLQAEDEPGLYYTLPEFNLRMDFRPTDFTQVNVHTNRLLIRRALQLLEPRMGERIADLFCGLGNFSLPIARTGAEVIGVEGSDALAGRAGENARRNGLHTNTHFYAANLFEATEDSLAVLGPLNKMLIDPPREGAIAVVKALGTRCQPARIVYVSCNPATLARDAAVLVHEKGYTLRGAGIANMFPQTSHVESVALFEYAGDQPAIAPKLTCPVSPRH